jgi:hypothetical protein
MPHTAIIKAVLARMLVPRPNLLFVNFNKTADKIVPIRLGSKRLSKKLINGVIEPVLLFVYKLTISRIGNIITSLLSTARRVFILNICLNYIIKY